MKRFANISRFSKIFSRTIMTSSVNITSLKSWNKEFQTDLSYSLASTVLKNYNADDLLLDKSRLLSQDKRVFNVSLPGETVTPVTNQKASGRCWLFAATNQLRPNVVKKLNLKDFELSQAYLFFYDKLEKANYFLDQIVSTKDEAVESRLVQYLLTSPTEDGGQYSMFLNIVKKYGLLPKDLYNDTTYSTTASRKLNALLTTKLREFAQQLRDALASSSDDHSIVNSMRSDMQKEIFKMMSMFMGFPPVTPTETFKWEYQDKDKNVHVLESTPLQFAEEYCGLKLSENKLPVSLINDPRHEYGRLIKIDRLGNVIGGDDVLYLNVDNDTLSKLVVSRLQAGKAVFFGSHTPKYMDKKNGVMDIQLWNYKAIGYDLKQDKQNRIKYNESLMTHAMLINACHLDESVSKDIPVRYRVENSWGKDSGKDGYYVMTQQYFEEYCFQIVVDLEDLPQELAKAFVSPSEPAIVLPLWDPMGALAD